MIFVAIQLMNLVGLRRGEYVGLLQLVYPGSVPLWTQKKNIHFPAAIYYPPTPPLSIFSCLYLVMH